MLYWSTMPLNLATDIVIRDGSGLPPQTGIAPIPEAEIQSLGLTDFAKSGLWPGIRRPPTVDGRGDETASASREPWVDANGYQVGYLRALHPDRPPVLAYVPDKLGDRNVPYDSLELALIEAWVAGGNYILAMEPHYREALLKKDAKAVAAWEQLGRTAQWLKENIKLFRQPSVPIVTALVEPGPTAEIANLLYRRNVSPALAPVTAPPMPDPQKRVAVVAANVKPPAPDVVKKVVAHAEAGSTLIVATSPSQQWWRVPGVKQIKVEQDREYYALGKGQIIAYKLLIADPSEFALDVIDIITHKRRAVRTWNAPAVIALATGERLMHLINYGSPIDMEVQARVQGHYSKATLLRPDGASIALAPAKRGSMTEVQVPELRRLGVVVFS
jgi:hypothetical protein